MPSLNELDINNLSKYQIDSLTPSQQQGLLMILDARDSNPKFKGLNVKGIQIGNLDFDANKQSQQEYINSIFDKIKIDEKNQKSLSSAQKAVLSDPTKNLISSTSGDVDSASKLANLDKILIESRAKDPKRLADNFMKVYAPVINGFNEEIPPISKNDAMGLGGLLAMANGAYHDAKTKFGYGEKYNNYKVNKIPLAKAMQGILGNRQMVSTELNSDKEAMRAAETLPDSWDTKEGRREKFTPLMRALKNSLGDNADVESKLGFGSSKSEIDNILDSLKKQQQEIMQSLQAK